MANCNHSPSGEHSFKPYEYSRDDQGFYFDCVHCKQNIFFEANSLDEIFPDEFDDDDDFYEERVKVINQNKNDMITEESFNALNSRDQWKWIVDNKEQIQMITLDNDNCSIQIKGLSDSCWYPHTWLGYSDGVHDLLNAIGIPCENC